MNKISKDVKCNVQQISLVADFLNISDYEITEKSTVEQIKRLCVLRLMKAVGVTGKYNCKSEFFEFFATIMGEAICEKLNIKIRIAPDNVRLIKYENINFVTSFIGFLDNDLLDEAFLDAFEITDKYKHLIPEIMSYKS